LSPKVFEIFKNDSLINQDAKASDYQQILEDQILKMNYKTFTQVVILGSSSFIPFMQLSAADRRSVIENILDINIFGTMNTLVKSKVAECKEAIKDTEYNIELLNNKIDSQNKLILLCKQNADSNFEIKQSKLSDFIDKRSILQKNYEDVVKKLKEKKELHGNLSKELKSVEKEIYQISFRQEQLNEEKEFYKNKTLCSLCKGEITKETKEKNLQEIEKNIQDNENKVKRLQKKQEKIQEEINSITIDDDVNSFVSDIKILDYEIRTLESEIEKSIKIEKDVSEYSQEMDVLNKSLSETQENLNKEKEKLEYLNYASILLKDGGVKSKIIKYYLPAMNKYINKYLSSMNFNIKFTLDEEFNENIKSRYRDDFSYMNFSEGEKMRIDLALLLSWREIAKLKNSVNCNLLILDEVFDSSLDMVGTDDVIRLLNCLGENTNVFVISHKADQIIDKFKNTMTFEKRGNFSKLVK
jgi:DNA repair exonuclease SbcCD ATPase subunit